MHSAHALTPGAGTPSTDAMAADTGSADTRSADTRSADTRSADTHCPYCALQCGMTVSRAADGRFGVQPRDFPSNKGGLCRKGWTAGELMTAPGRLLTPLLRDRRGGPLRESTWDEALGLVASRIGTIQGTHGRDAMAVFGGGGLTNEKAYLLGKFARVALGTANIDYNGRFCMAAAAAAGIKAFGLDRGLPFPLDDIPGAEAILLTGGNPAETMPPIMQYFEAQRARGGKLIVVDPRLTPTARVAAVHLQLTPGTDAALANGMLHVALQHNLLDRHFIDTRTEGFERVRRIAASYWLDRVERITGVPAKKITEATHLLAEAATAMLLSGRGTEQQSSGTDNVLAFINLFLAIGQAGRKHCGYGAMTGQGNGQGGREHGQKADQLPGYRRIDDPAARAAVAAVWGIDPATLPGPGMSAVELLGEMGGRVRGLLVMASNLAVSAPDANAVIGRLGALDLLVVSDMFLSETAALADVVLPTTQWAEEDGTMTNLEGRVILRRQVVAPPAGVRTDAEILSELAARLEAASTFPADTAAIADEMRRASAGGPADYTGITWEKVEAQRGVFWPCPSGGHAGTPRLFLDRFAHADGRARFHPVQHRDSIEMPDRDYPLFLTTGRLLAHYQTGAQTRRVRELAEAEPEPFVELHPSTARMHGIASGDLVRVATRRGTAELRARLTAGIRMDTLFVPFHWGGAQSANALTISALDPVSRIPEFKVCAAALERVAGAQAAPAAAAQRSTTPSPAKEHA